MNKNKGITSAEYQHKVRQQSKARQHKFRQEQVRRGYKNVSVFLSESFIQELDKLSTEQGLNRQAAMDYIFGIYQSNVTSNITLTDDKAAETLVNSEPQENFKDKAVNNTEKIIEIMDKSYQAGAKWHNIAQALNAKGLLTARGKRWTGANAQIYYARNIKY